MGAIMRSTDWSKTKLGPVEDWPRSLRTMLGVVLGSRFPMLLWWGPDLLHLYNDAYRPILRDKHPASLAAPAAEVWAEVWDVAGPMAQSVQEGGPATWTEDLQLFINSGGMAEETYFTFSYSPVPGDDGQIGGLLNTVQETTEKVQGERQIRMLHDLSARAAHALSESDAYRIATEVLSANELDLPFALLYRVNEKTNLAELVGASRLDNYEGPAKPRQLTVTVDRNGHHWPLGDVVRDGREIVIDDLARRFGPLPRGRWNARPDRAILMPLSRAGQPMPTAFLIAGISPHRSLNSHYQRFFRATADQVMAVIERACAYEAEKQRAEALAEIDRAKTTFFSNVSHEFRTPLTLILAPVEDALAQPAKSLQGEGLQTVHRSAIRLRRLVNSLLDFARIEAGRLQVTFVPTDLSSLTKELASSFRSLIEQAGLELVVDCPPIPDVVYVDPIQWEKIVLNLLSNAFKFTFQGQIAVSLRSLGDHVELRVRDNGVGIPENELPHIFDRFHRVEGTTGRSFEGTGIGLSMVHELTKLHGGSVSASSVVDRGSTFVVSIPTGISHLPSERIVDRGLPSPTVESATPFLMEASQWIASGQQPSSGPEIEFDGFPVSADATSTRGRARVLVVDDNADMRDYLARLLSNRWQVQVAENGHAALASVQDEIPDLIVSDVMMPGMDGVALLRELRSNSRTRQIPVVLISARAGEESLLEGVETGADDYIIKPFAARELMARVNTHLELSRVRREWLKELERANSELEAFSYSVSHDLRAPLRAIDGFSKLLLANYASRLDEQGRHYLERVRFGTQRMGELIDDLLSLSRIARTAVNRERVDMTEIARRILIELAGRDTNRAVEYRVAEGLVVEADPRLVRVMLENLLDNSWKFTSKQPKAIIEVAGLETGHDVFYVRDNGAGFNMNYAEKLFAPFQRLHPDSQFEGTGIGLATVNRIVNLHGGKIWAEAEPGKGATFFFCFGAQK